MASCVRESSQRELKAEPCPPKKREFQRRTRSAGISYVGNEYIWIWSIEILEQWLGHNAINNETHNFSVQTTTV